MAGKIYLLDTNVIIDLFAGEKKVAEKLAIADKLYVPSIVLGELYYGAHNSGKKSHHLKQIKEFTGICEVVDVDEETASHYGEVKAQLKKKGTPIPENDVWIASLAMQHKLTLLTSDKHFGHIKSLKREAC